MINAFDTIELKKKAMSASAEGRYEDAVSDYAAILAMEPDDLAMRQKHAFALGQVGRRGEAIEEYYFAAQAYFDAHDLRGALALARVILRWAPRHAATVALLARVFAERPAEARRETAIGAAQPRAAHS
jgi:hypothetical protein